MKKKTEVKAEIIVEGVGDGRKQLIKKKNGKSVVDINNTYSIEICEHLRSFYPAAHKNGFKKLTHVLTYRTQFSLCIEYHQGKE